MHQGIGLDAFNAWPLRKAVHALYECANCVTLAADLARGRAYVDRDALFRRADLLLFALPESAIDEILDAHPLLGQCPRTAVRTELARINRARLERMLGPEGGYDNW
jgi:2-oxo-4-hydroxy-4-carboxy-5-ureidoimidazoline decarboxylase